MRKQLIAIVGRPNVGKSTLFNRIIRRREAIVDNVAGVTRDRNYADTDWAGVPFTLVDTGGFLPDGTDSIQKAVLSQLHGAIQEADAIILMMDAQTGLTSDDLEMRQILKRSQKPVLVAVNKADNDNVALNAAEFYQLALGDPIPIAALSGRNIGDFLDRLVSILPNQAIESEFESEAAIDHQIKLAVIGRPNVGKSSFVNAILGYEKQIVTDIPGTTRDAIDTIYRFQEQDLLLIDTAGIRRRSRIKGSIEFYSAIRTHDSIRRSDVAIVLFDALEGLSAQDKTIIQEVIENKKGIILAANKWDLVEKDTNTAQRYEKLILEHLGRESYLPVMFISALTKQRVFKILELACAIYHERQKRIKTSELNEFLEQTIRSYPPSDYGKYEVKIKYVTQVNTAPPVFAFFTNFPEGIKENYKKYLENKLREKFGYFGIPLVLTFKKK